MKPVALVAVVVAAKAAIAEPSLTLLPMGEPRRGVKLLLPLHQAGRAGLRGRSRAQHLQIEDASRQAEPGELPVAGRAYAGSRAERAPIGAIGGKLDFDLRHLGAAAGSRPRVTVLKALFTVRVCSAAVVAPTRAKRKRVSPSTLLKSPPR